MANSAALFIFYCCFINVAHCHTTIVNSLKNGFDSCYKYEEKIIKVHSKIETLESLNYEVLFRRASVNNRILMQLNDIKYIKIGFDNEDLYALDLPIIVAVTSDTMLDSIYASINDTSNSINSKYNTLQIAIHDFTETIRIMNTTLGPIKSIAFDMHWNDLPFGNCNTTFKCSQRFDEYVIEVNTKVGLCSGNIQPELLRIVGAPNLYPDSELYMSFHFDKYNWSFIKSKMLLNVTALSRAKQNVKITRRLRFDKYQEFEKDIDESLYTVSNLYMYIINMIIIL